MNFRSAILLILVIILLKPKKTSTMGRKGPRAKTKIVLKSVSKVDQLGLGERLAPKTQISKLRLAHLDFDWKLNSKSDLFSSIFLFEHSFCCFLQG